jgi:hypothetical protein
MAEEMFSKPMKFSSLMVKFTSIPIYFERLDIEKDIRSSFVEIRMKDIDTAELSDFMCSLSPQFDKEFLEGEKSEQLRELRISLRKEADDISPYC